MGGSSSKANTNTCQSENNQIKQLKSQLQQYQDQTFQSQLQQSKNNYDPENDNNILMTQVGGRGKRRKKSYKRRKKATRRRGINKL